ncbi:TPA: hypothetical protein KOO48_002029 [Clostridioides difficile]|nr:hypothetical protein [Clostridioides difficile]HBF9108133.1 hypothetical protein [Clostridioides difficile]
MGDTSTIYYNTFKQTMKRDTRTCILYGIGCLMVIIALIINIKRLF